MSAIQTTTHIAAYSLLIREMAARRGGCIGCKDCTGACTDLIDMIFLPETLLSKDHSE